MSAAALAALEECERQFAALSSSASQLSSPPDLQALDCLEAALADIALASSAPPKLRPDALRRQAALFEQITALREQRAQAPCGEIEFGDVLTRAAAALARDSPDRNELQVMWTEHARVPLGELAMRLAAHGAHTLADLAALGIAAAAAALRASPQEAPSSGTSRNSGCGDGEPLDALSHHGSAAAAAAAVASATTVEEEPESRALVRSNSTEYQICSPFDRGHLTKLHELGSGQFGTVHMCLLGAEPCVAKMIEIKGGRGSFAASMNAIEEAKSLMALSHTNIVSFLDVFGHQTREEDQPSELSATNFVCILMEFCSLGTVADFAFDAGFDVHALLAMLFQVCSGLQYLHDKCHLAHCDIKLENLLLHETKKGEATTKISDFGSVQRLSPAVTESGEQVLATAMLPTGTVAYQAPECLPVAESLRRGLPGVTAVVDTWSLGCALWEAATTSCLPLGTTADVLGCCALSERWPTTLAAKTGVFSAALTKLPSSREPLAKSASKQLATAMVAVLPHLLSTMWTIDWRQRPTMGQLLAQGAPARHCRFLIPPRYSAQRAARANRDEDANRAHVTIMPMDTELPSIGSSDMMMMEDED
eukprot:m.160806 g.160806  ORF g.160806 m.160806 type:complete len:595 (+) comp10278_c0_seq2:125-1909(+)